VGGLRVGGGKFVGGVGGGGGVGDVWVCVRCVGVCVGFVVGLLWCFCLFVKFCVLRFFSLFLVVCFFFFFVFFFLSLL